MSAHSTSAPVPGQPQVDYRDLAPLGFPGYRVGDDGSVWSRHKQGTAKSFHSSWHRLTPGPDRKGYLRLKLYTSDGSWERVSVHALVLLAFVGPKPDDAEACHDPDPDPANNSLANLRWGTAKDNGQGKVRHGHSSFGERNAAAKLTADQVKEALTRLAAGETQQSVGDSLGVSQAHMSRLALGVNWKHLSH